MIREALVVVALAAACQGCTDDSPITVTFRVLDQTGAPVTDAEVSCYGFVDFVSRNGDDYVCTVHFGMDGTLNVTNFGDANLDGVVNLNDFNVLAANFGQSNRTWEQGDFNEDGTVNLSDFNLLAANFGKQIEPAPPGTTISFGLGDQMVPEPATLALMLLEPALMARRRKS